ncbi:MAG: hypothetical protein ACJAT1_002315, partial [Marivirga sp.]
MRMSVMRKKIYTNILVLSLMATSFLACNRGSEKPTLGSNISAEESPFQQQIDSLLNKMTLQ